ncbi:GH32 C-terminal domain-containing protein [Corynebacterium halotolerans]|uniref:beta-fructofuranosidase n=1 Tax=Corynebacterium halotolerans YIM 70093 = DSM 44683 TaxID=1121362 RepID=M1NRL0_9CORY|nr:GH32 C-terminal domain-containing protein [Corynebacterium halotolerans]AGF72137.1 glycoside hydrolase [Corynebacterium halotolerans YIM 70093 = DSM 44683]
MSTSSHRPELHVTAETGVLDAPAGALLDGDTWHLFHQFRPKPGAPARWAHTVSEEGPFDWEICDDVISPVGGETTVRAGSVVATEDSVHLYFTSVTAVGTSIQLARMTDFSSGCEVSDEASTLDSRVLRVGDVVSDRDGLSRFRSPSVVPDWASEADRAAGHDGWLMLAVSGPGESPVPVILTSGDGIQWHLVGALEFAGDPGLESVSVIVSPRIMRLRDEVDGRIYDVLLITVEDGNVDISGYLVGTLTGATFEVKTGFTRIDHGHDFTRPRNTNFTPGTVAEENRYSQAVLFGLLNGVGRRDDPAHHPSLTEEGWANAVSLPRVVTLQGGHLFQTPPPGLPDAVTHTSAARSWTGLCEIPTGSSLTLELFDGGGEVAGVVTHSGEHLRVDRSMNRHHSGDPVAEAPLAEGDSDSLSIFIDGSTVEVFADGGAVAMSSRVYFDDGCSGLRVTTEGDAEIIRSWDRGPVTSGDLPDYGEPPQE